MKRKRGESENAAKPCRRCCPGGGAPCPAHDPARGGREIESKRLIKTTHFDPNFSARPAFWAADDGDFCLICGTPFGFDAGMKLACAVLSCPA